MNLKKLHENFIEASDEFTVRASAPPLKPKFSKLPISAIIPWENKGKYLLKSYSFDSNDEKIKMVNELMHYEEETKHNATILIENKMIVVKLSTRDIEQITQIDHEYAKFADEAYKEIIDLRGYRGNEFF